MLDHLEKSTGRLYQSGLVLKDEARVHNQLLDGRGCLFVCLLVCLFVCFRLMYIRSVCQIIIKPTYTYLLFLLVCSNGPRRRKQQTVYIQRREGRYAAGKKGMLDVYRIVKTGVLVTLIYIGLS